MGPSHRAWPCSLPGILVYIWPKLDQSDARSAVWIWGQKQEIQGLRDVREFASGVFSMVRDASHAAPGSLLPQFWPLNSFNLLGPSNKVLFWDQAGRSWFLCPQPGEPYPPTSYTFFRGKRIQPRSVGSEAQVFLPSLGQVCNAFTRSKKPGAGSQETTEPRGEEGRCIQQQEC